jgi:hypothetical protein
MDSLVGDCMGEPVPPLTTPVPGGLGRPSSVTPGRVMWHWKYSSTDAAVVTADLTINVAGPTP